MAEAAVEIPTNLDRFYCHSCTKEITPDLPDYTCPQCADGFVEQINEEQNITSQLSTQDSDPESLFDAMRSSFVNHIEHLSVPSPENDSSPTLISIHHQNPRRVTIEHRAQPRNVQMQGLVNYFLSQLTQMDTGVHMPGGGMFQLHGNPADYAWGAHGLDSIISQLLNQLEGSGAPPAPEEKIDALPLVKIDKHQIESNLQCSVCMEDYQLGDEANKLPCDHHYHPPCIIPWLKLHGTCPVCRKDLNGEEVQVKDNYDEEDSIL